MTTQPTTSRGWRLPFLYERLVVRGRIVGAIRVLFGKNASVPKGEHNTALGLMSVRDYYGGLILTLPECDIYWTATKLDGWGAGLGQRKFVPEALVQTLETVAESTPVA